MYKNNLKQKSKTLKSAKKWDKQLIAVLKKVVTYRLVQILLIQRVRKAE
jgi:hypothetical protein